MLVAITVLHIIITLSLIGLVLLQDPKGGAMGLIGGSSGSQSVFGATGAGNFLVTATKWMAVAFGITCITLTYFTSHRERSVTDDLLPAAAPVTGPAVPGTVPAAGIGTTAPTTPTAPTTATPTPAATQAPAPAAPAPKTPDTK